MIIKKRATGKTTELIKIASQNNSTIVCVNNTRVNNVLEQSNKMGIEIKQPITWYDFIAKSNWGADRVDNFLVDDLDACVQSMTDVPIRAVTMTEEDNNENAICK